MISVVGINYKNTPVEIREKFSFDSEEAVHFMKHLTSVADIDGVVLLSTCNRMEIYYQNSVENIDLYQLIIEECRAFKNNPEEVSFYYYQDDACAKHLFRVAAGLDSMVKCEYQILGQVKDAYRLSTQHDCSSPLLSRLFHKAFEAGKKVQNHVKSKRTPVSAGTEAVELIRDLIPEKNVNILVFGAGLMADNILATLKKYSFSNIVLFNRSYSRAEKLCTKFNVSYCPQGELYTRLKEADVVFVATAALYPVLKPSMLLDRAKSIICIDLGVPRNIDPQVKDIEGVSLFTIDNLKNLTSHQEILFEENEIEQIIQKIVIEFNEWLHLRKYSPIISAINQKFERVLEQHLNNIKNKVSDNEFRLIQESGNCLKEKYISSFMTEFRGLLEKEGKQLFSERTPSLIA